MYFAIKSASHSSRERSPRRKQTGWLRNGDAVKRGRGGAISFLVPGQQRAPRLRSSTLGAGFDSGEIRDVVAGKRPLPKLDAPAPVAPRRVDLIVDI